MTSYLIFTATMAGIYALLSLGLVKIWGHGGMVNLGLVGFYAVGAYGSALLSMTGTPIGLTLAFGAVVAGAVGVLVSYITRPLRGDYLAIVSLGFAEVIRLVATNEKWLTGGSDGLPGLRAPLKAELGDYHSVFYMVLVWAIVAAAAWVLTRLARSPYGRALRALRDDEQVAAVAGKPVLSLKLKAFFIGAALTGLAGGLYAHFTSYIAPDGFVPLITIYIFLSATAGGYTRVKGAIVGAVIVTLLLESSRFLGDVLPSLTAGQVAALREFLIAVSLILIMQFKPDGLLKSKPQLSGPEPQPGAGPAKAAGTLAAGGAR
jgi:branched-chain amino acid transport system permease protein